MKVGIARGCVIVGNPRGAVELAPSGKGSINSSDPGSLEPRSGSKSCEDVAAGSRGRAGRSTVCCAIVSRGVVGCDSAVSVRGLGSVSGSSPKGVWLP